MRKLKHKGYAWLLCLVAACSLGITAAHAADELILEKEKMFKGMKAPAIAQFNVSFAYSDIKQAGSYKDKWRKLDGKSESAMRVNLKGLSDATMQKITDATYADFKSKLEKAGVSIATADLHADLPKWITKEIDRYTKEGYPENQSHYDAYGAVDTKTVPFSGSKVIDYKYRNMIGYAAKERKQEFIAVNYLLHFGYLDTESKRAENSFMSEVYLKTGVTFHPGVQVYWRSGAEVYQKSHSKIGAILINQHIGAPGEYGEMKVVEQSDWGKAYKEIDIAVDEEAYAKLAIDALAQANTKIVDQIAKLQ